jgi:hypothetical protein
MGAVHLKGPEQSTALILRSLPAMHTVRFPLFAALLVLLTFSLSSCDAIGTIFKAGAWTGIVGVFLLVLLIWFVVNRFRRS